MQHPQCTMRHMYTLFANALCSWLVDCMMNGIRCLTNETLDISEKNYQWKGNELSHSLTDAHVLK